MNIEKKIKKNITLASYTTFCIGGPASYFIEPETLNEYKGCISWALKRAIPFYMLGGGANILIHDNGYRGLIINTKRLNTIEIEDTTVVAECGVMVDTLVDVSLQYSLSGIEFAAGLPGTVGGALFINASAFNGAFSDIVQKVHTLHVKDRAVKEKILQKGDLRFSYKESIFQNMNYFVYKVILNLTKGSHSEIHSKIEQNRKKRIEMGQYIYPNAGCIFKNDYTIGKPAGRIIEEAGLKGIRIGKAEVYQKHANFIINRGNATAGDVYLLIKLIEDEVYKRTGIKLEREIFLLGDWK